MPLFLGHHLGQAYRSIFWLARQLCESMLARTGALNMDRSREITRQQIEARLASLKSEYDKGQAAHRELEQQLASLRETMLRISGAIHVLEELLSSSASVTARQQESEANRATQLDTRG